MRIIRQSIVIVLLAAGLASAQTRVKSVSEPKTGLWKYQPPGMFVVFKSNAYDTGIVYRRELLLGVDDTGTAVIAYAHSDQPDGPWQPIRNQRRGPEDPAGDTKSLGKKTLKVAGKPAECEGVRVETKGDDATVIIERWTDLATGRLVRKIRTTRKNAVTAVERETIVQDDLLKIEPRQIGTATVQAAVYTSTTIIDSVLRMSRRTAFSDEVPGERVAYTRWVGAEMSAEPVVDDVAIAIGKDVDAVINITGMQPSEESPDVAATQPTAPSAAPTATRP